MQDFMITLLICSATMSMLAVMYMATTPLLSKRYSEKGRYYAWLIIIIGLIIPFRPQWDNAIVNVELPTQTAVTAEQFDGGTLPFANNVAIFMPIEDVIIPNASLVTSWWQIGFTLWLTGMILFFTFQVIRHYRFMKMIKRWSENITDRQILATFENLKSEMSITKPIPIYLCSCVGSPMLVGIINPKILLPTAELAKDELQLILKHELVHYKRKDLLYKFLVLVATAIHWFNPIMYLSVRVINILCETSCDTEVINGTDSNTRQMYSEAIVGVVKYQSKLKTALSTNFYGGRKGMKNRISSIMNTSKKRKGVVLLCVLFVMTVSAGFVFASNSGEVAPESIISNLPNMNTLASEHMNVTNPSIEQSNNSVSANYNLGITNETAPLRVNSSAIAFYDEEYLWPFQAMSFTNVGNKPIVGYTTMCLAFDKYGKPLELFWDAWNVSSCGSIGSVGGHNMMVVGISPRSPKSYYHIRQHGIVGNGMEWLEDEDVYVPQDMRDQWVEWLTILPEQTIAHEQGGWSLFYGWNQSTGEHIVAHFMTIVTQVIFDDGTVWINPNVDDWLSNHKGQSINVNTLE